jgi:hypothetical protein
MKVFVSSPYGGLADEREAVRGALDPPHAIEMMEEFGSSGLPPLETCIEKLVKCRVCVLIVGPRYGTPVPNLDISYTEAEYETARERGIRSSRTSSKTLVRRSTAPRNQIVTGSASES